MNVGNKVIYSVQTPKMFLTSVESHYLYFMRLNTFCWEEVNRFQQTLKEVHSFIQYSVWRQVQNLFQNNSST
jgi:hypothetical protein